MTLLQKQKIKSRFTIILFALLGISVAWLSDASAQDGYFNGIGGCNVAGCHDGGDGSGGAVVAQTCDGCHAHGVHSGSSKNDVNITATTEFSSYAVGDTISIIIDGGYKREWVRVNVYDDTGALVAQSRGICDPGGACAEGSGFPVTLTTTATTTGTQIWTASWYGNDYDAFGSAGGSNASGSGVSTGVTDPGWLVDGNNLNHGQEIVAIAAFTVSDASAGGGSNTGGTNTGTVSSGGGGGLSWPVVLLLLFIVIATLYRDKTIRT